MDAGADGRARVSLWKTKREVLGPGGGSGDGEKWMDLRDSET